MAVVGLVRVDCDGVVSAVTVEGEGSVLAALQAGVGGMVDVVRLPDDIDMWVGDEAAFCEPVNAWASVLNGSHGGQPAIWGPVMFAACDEYGATVSLSEAQASTLAGWFVSCGAGEAAQAVAAVCGVHAPARV